MMNVFEWDEKASDRMKKVPIFVRGFAKRKVEEYVRAKGKTRITEEDIDATKKIMFSKTGTDTNKLIDVMKEEFTSTDIEKSVEVINEDNNGNKKLYEVTGCNEKHTCPLSLKNTGSLLKRLTDKLEQMNITKSLFDKIEGPVVYHHTFRVTVSECPNACSQPQIKDFGVIVESLPGYGINECINCNLCVEECKEDAITISDNGVEIKPVIDYSKCVRCDACVRVCPVETLLTEKQGYSVFIGGKLGRHPQFAIKILDLVDEETVVKALEICVDKYLKEAKGSERFGNFATRTLIPNKETFLHI